jgi:hypothetical protein
MAAGFTQSAARRIVQEPVGIGTGNPRQSGANYDLFDVNLTIPYQQWIDVGVVPIFRIAFF